MIIGISIIGGYGARGRSPQKTVGVGKGAPCAVPTTIQAVF